MPDNSVNNKRIAKNSLFLSIRMVIVLGISLYTTRLVLKILGVEDYGVYNVVCGFVAMFAFLNTSMSNGIQRFYNYEYGKNGIEGANKVYCTSLIIQLILAIIVVLLTEAIGLWYLYNKMVIPEGRMIAAEWVFHTSVLSFFFVIIQAPYTAAVMAHERMGFYAVVNVADAILKLLTLFLIPLFRGDQLVFFGFIQLSITIFNFVLYYLYAKKHLDEIRFHLIKEKSLLRSMLGFSGWNLFGSFSGVMKEQGINLVLNYFSGPIVNAARGVAAQVNSGVLNFISNILTPVRPQVIQSYASGNYSRSINLTLTISKFSIVCLFMLSLPICLEVDFILRLWLGSNIPDHSHSFIVLVLLISLIQVPMGALATLVHASGKMRKYQLYASAVKLLCVPAAFFFMALGYAPEWSLVMVLIFDFVGLIVGMIIIESIMPFKILSYIKSVIIPLLPVTILSFIVTILSQKLLSEGVLRLIIVILVAFASVSFFFYIIGVSKSERKFIKTSVSNMLSRLHK